MTLGLCFEIIGSTSAQINNKWQDAIFHFSCYSILLPSTSRNNANLNFIFPIQTSSIRRLIELDEAIEALDAAIDYKNELIMSHQVMFQDGLAAANNEDALLLKLQSLSTQETRSLLARYFDKVVDLKDTLRKSELQCRELEVGRFFWLYEFSTIYIWYPSPVVSFLSIFSSQVFLVVCSFQNIYLISSSVLVLLFSDWTWYCSDDFRASLPIN